ncbi:hypothetical protein GCM10022267_05550 [Lentzea roselyniae]|uniref:Uncharacterized protein n=1 Tax=Lentzea roselyniae TaxID=531940 RepID=A0ABP6ZXR4_9PSEU
MSCLRRSRPPQTESVPRAEGTVAMSGFHPAGFARATPKPAVRERRRTRELPEPLPASPG